VENEEEFNLNQATGCLWKKSWSLGDSPTMRSVICHPLFKSMNAEFVTANISDGQALRWFALEQDAIN
jgi:hypothetical protein